MLSGSWFHKRGSREEKAPSPAASVRRAARRSELPVLRDRWAECGVIRNWTLDHLEPVERAQDWGDV